MWDFVSARAGWIWSPEPHGSNSIAPVKGTLYRTDNGGESWEMLKADGLEEYLARGQDIVQVDFVDRDFGWAIARDWHNRAQLLCTSDGGQTWDVISTVRQESKP